MAGGLDEEQEAREGVERLAAPKTGVSAMARGTLAHHLLELWDFRTEAPVDRVLAAARLGLGQRAALAEDLRALAERFLASELGRRMAAEERIQREAPFILTVGDALVTGTIDALLEDGTIIDYKTGAFDPARHDRYEWQLLLYAAAVDRLLGQRPPTGILHYVDEGVSHEVVLSAGHVEAAMRHAAEIVAQMRQGPPGAASRV